MVPTIDFGVTAVLAAIGAFLAWVWRFSCGAAQFIFDRIKLLYYGNALFRAALHVTFFITLYAGFARLVLFIWNQVSDHVFSSFPQTIQNAIAFISLVIPLDTFATITVHAVSLVGLALSVNVAYIGFRRVERWLMRLTSR